MIDKEILDDCGNTESYSYYSSLISEASASGWVYIDRLERFAEYPDITEEKFTEILCALADRGIDVLPYAEYPFDNRYFKEMLKEILKYPLENENKTAMRKNDDPIKLYFDEIVNIPVISHGEERDLIFDIADGEEDKKERLIESAMFIPVALAYKYLGKDVLFLDLVQEGNMELMSAAEQFDYSKNISFFAYAAFRINRKLLELTDNDHETVRLPAGLAEDISKILEETGKNTGENKRKLTDRELSEILDIPQERISAARAALRDISDGKTSARCEKATAAEVPEQQKSEAEKQLSKQVEDILAALPEKEAKIIAMRFGIGHNKAMTAEEIAEKLGEDTEEIKKCEQQALRMLGAPQTADAL